MCAAIARGIRRAALPLACYYAVTLGLPLANGATAAGGDFMRHALAVLVTPMVLVAFVSTCGEIAASLTRSRCDTRCRSGL
jgi:hypothetical protein